MPWVEGGSSCSARVDDAPPVYGFPNLGDVDFTPQGLDEFRKLCDDLYGPDFFAEATVESDDESEVDYYALDKGRADRFLAEAKDKEPSATVGLQQVGPWCIYWWKCFETGYRVTVRRAVAGHTGGVAARNAVSNGVPSENGEPPTIPFVIDNQEHRLADVLNALLDRSVGKPLDIATAYFTVSGYRLVRDRLPHVGAFRLLLGSEPIAGPDVGLRPAATVACARLRADLEAEAFNPVTLKLVEHLRVGFYGKRRRALLVREIVEKNSAVVGEKRQAPRIDQAAGFPNIAAIIAPSE